MCKKKIIIIICRKVKGMLCVCESIHIICHVNVCTKDEAVCHCVGIYIRQWPPSCIQYTYHTQTDFNFPIDECVLDISIHYNNDATD